VKYLCQQQCKSAKEPAKHPLNQRLPANQTQTMSQNAKCMPIADKAQQTVAGYNPKPAPSSTGHDT
jgi:hypothetical protein